VRIISRKTSVVIKNSLISFQLVLKLLVKVNEINRNSIGC
jgi:hypothetical protein